jgi:hypothetical protein
MNVIRHSADGDQAAFVFTEDATNVSIEAVSDVVADHRSAVLGAEDDMVMEAGERLGHKSEFRPFRASKFVALQTRGLRPWLIAFAAPRLVEIVRSRRR